MIFVFSNSTFDCKSSRNNELKERDGKKANTVGIEIRGLGFFLDIPRCVWPICNFETTCRCPRARWRISCVYFTRYSSIERKREGYRRIPYSYVAQK